jgi:hypothetical protein
MTVCGGSQASSPFHIAITTGQSGRRRRAAAADAPDASRNCDSAGRRQPKPRRLSEGNTGVVLTGGGRLLRAPPGTDTNSLARDQTCPWGEAPSIPGPPRAGSFWPPSCGASSKVKHCELTALGFKKNQLPKKNIRKKNQLPAPAANCADTALDLHSTW